MPVFGSLSSLPRLATSQVHLTTYYRWELRGEWLDKPAYLFLRVGYRQTYTFVTKVLLGSSLGATI